MCDVHSDESIETYWRDQYESYRAYSETLSNKRTKKTVLYRGNRYQFMDKGVPYKWIAMDETGEICLFKDKPILSYGMWMPSEQKSRALILATVKETTDYEDSLEEIVYV